MARKWFPPKSETSEDKIQRRWLQSVIAASDKPLPAFPWMRAAKSGATDRAAVEMLTGEAHRPAKALFRRNGPPGSIAAR